MKYRIKNRFERDDEGKPWKEIFVIQKQYLTFWKKRPYWSDEREYVCNGFEGDTISLSFKTLKSAKEYLKNMITDYPETEVKYEIEK